MAQLVRGDQAPDFRLQDSNGTWVSLADYAPGKVILYFYPAALTPTCTVQAVDFSAALTDFREAGYTILGVSPDDPGTLKTFIGRNNLSVTLLSDPSMSTIQAYGAWGERLMWGKTITGLIRSTFIIDVDGEGKGTIQEAEYSVRGTGHVDRLREKLGF